MFMKLVFYGASNMHMQFYRYVNSSYGLNDIYLTNRSNEVALKEYAEKVSIIVMMMKRYCADYVFLGLNLMISNH